MLSNPWNASSWFSRSGAPLCEDLRGQPDAIGERLLRLLQPVFDVVGELDHVGALIVQGHVDDVGLERLTQLVAEALDQDVEPQLLGDRLADVVHDRQLGRVLTRLLEQPGVLERDAQAARERREQPDVALAEGMLAVEVLERDDAGGPAADDERHEDPGQRRLALEHERLPGLGRSLREVLVHHDGGPGVQRLLPEAARSDRLVREPHATLDDVREVDHPRVPIEDPDVDDLRVEDLLEAVADQVVHRLRLEVLGQATLHGR